MDLFHERKIADCISPQSWGHSGCEDLELLQVFSKLDVRNIVHDIQQSYAGTSVGNGLVKINIPCQLSQGPSVPDLRTRYPLDSFARACPGLPLSI